MEFRILGPLEVSSEAGLVPITAAKHRALLLHLLVHANEVVSSDSLVDALWGERPPASARKLLQVYVSRLRKALGDSVLVTRPPGYLIAVEWTQLDSARFERLAAEGGRVLGEDNPALASRLLASSLALWRGAALADVAYEPAIQTEARRLEEVRLKVLEQRVEADLQLGRGAELVGELQALTGTYPLRERFRAQLMLSLYRSGRQAEAVDVYAEARRALVEELGVEPSAELRELQHAILNQDPALGSPPERLTTVRLPAPATRLIGREREMLDVERLLGDPDIRLVTIMGPGGIGKTRLALEAATRSSGAFANGVVFVELAALTDSTLVLPSIAESLGIKEQVGETLSRTLAGAIRSRELLLVLDNLEQVLDAAPALAELLVEAPRLKLLGTSRARLRLSGEHVYRVPPLAVPDPSVPGDLTNVVSSAAVTLFTEGARAAEPGFALTDGNVSAVAEICTRLEGVPLAIELAAARIRTLNPTSLLERLSRRLPLLTEGAWDLPARQQTLRATIDWSYDLLNPAEQSLLAVLGVFVGGWTLETAELVGASEDVLGALAGLQDNSLVGSEPTVGEAARYRMLETVREYALERLDEVADAGSVRDRHAQAFVVLAEQAEAALAGPEQGLWQERLELEHGNLRAALAWLHGSGQVELELRLAAALGRFWYVRGHLSEGRRRLESALALDGAAALPQLRAKALRAASAIAVIQGEYASAGELAKQGLELYEALGDRVGSVRSLSNLGAILLAEGRTEEAVSVLDESIALARQLPDRRLVALALNNRGDVALTQGDHEAAGRFFEESLTLLRELGDTANIARSLFNLGAATLERGHTLEALELLQESAAISVSVGDKEDVAWCLVGLAAAATQRREPDRGAVVLGAAAALLEGMGALMKPFERGLQERTLAAIREQLDARSLDEAWARGRALTIEQAVAYAVAAPDPG